MLGSAKEKHLIAVMEWIISFLGGQPFFMKRLRLNQFGSMEQMEKNTEGHQNFPRTRLKKEADSSNIISRVFIKGTEHKTTVLQGWMDRGKCLACLLSVSQRPGPRTSRWKGKGRGLRGFTVLVQEQSPPSLLSFSLPLPRASLLKRKYKPVC